MQPKYKRILLKLSGEALAGKAGSGLDFDTVLTICQAVKRCAEAGVQVGIVVGGGNFWRGRSSGKMDRTRARPYGYAGYGHQRFGAGRCAGAAGL